VFRQNQAVLLHSSMPLFIEAGTRKDLGRDLKPLFQAAIFTRPTPCDISPLARSMFRVLFTGRGRKTRPGQVRTRFYGHPALLFRKCTCRKPRRHGTTQHSFLDFAKTITIPFLTEEGLVVICLGRTLVIGDREGFCFKLGGKIVTIFFGLLKME
jgi:hypothetical protein